MTRKFTGPAMPDADPTPWLTDLWRQSGCFDVDSAAALNRLGKAMAQTYGEVSGPDAFGVEAKTLHAIAQSVQSTVAGLHADAKQYRVVFDPNVSTAGTSYAETLVALGTRPLSDVTLTDGQRASILSGASLHETGHINDSQPFRDAVLAKYGYPTKVGGDASLAHKVSGIGEDNRIERLQSDRYSGLVKALETAMWFYAYQQEKRLAEQGESFPFPILTDTPKNRQNALLIGVRYAWHGDWSSPAADKALDFLLPWRDAMTNCATPTEHVRLVGEAIAWIKAAPQPDVQQPPQGGGGTPNPDPSGQPSNQPGSGSGPSDQPGESNESGDDSDEESESNDDDGDGEPKSGNSPSPKDEGEGKGQGQSQGDSDSQGESKDEGEPEDGDSPSTGASQFGQGQAKMPEYSDDCAAHSLRDPAHDATADKAVAAHEGVKRAVNRMRRYPYGIGGKPIKGGALVAETVFDKFADLLSEKEAKPKISDQGVQSAALGRTIHLYAEPKATLNGVGITISPHRAAALAGVLNSAKKGTGSPERGCRSGRLDRRALHRVAVADPKVFIRRTASAPQKVRAYITLDASGSMGSGHKATQAVQAGVDLAGALELIPWAKGKVYAHTSGNAYGSVTPLWESGQPVSEVGRYFSVPQGGTPEGLCLAFICDDLLSDLRSGERGVVIVVSDGQPDDVAHVKEVADFYRQRGIRIVSVSIDRALDDAAQQMMYGSDHLPYDPNTSVFARSLAKVIGATI